MCLAGKRRPVLAGRESGREGELIVYGMWVWHSDGPLVCPSSDGEGQRGALSTFVCVSVFVFCVGVWFVPIMRVSTVLGPCWLPCLSLSQQDWEHLFFGLLEKGFQILLHSAPSLHISALLFSFYFSLICTFPSLFHVFHPEFFWILLSLTLHFYLDTKTHFSLALYCLTIRFSPLTLCDFLISHFLCPI